MVTLDQVMVIDRLFVPPEIFVMTSEGIELRDCKIDPHATPSVGTIVRAEINTPDEADRRTAPLGLEKRPRAVTSCCSLNFYPWPILQAPAAWRRHFFDLAKDGKAPIAVEAVRRMDELFEIERTINGKSPQVRLTVRRDLSKPLVDALETWLYEQRARLSAKNDMTTVINYGLSRWAAFTRFLDDGRVCLTNNAAERSVRGIAVGRRNWTFAGSDEGGRRAAAVYTLIETCKLNDVDPQAWLTDVLGRLPDHPAKQVHELLPWAWKCAREPTQAVAA